MNLIETFGQFKWGYIVLCSFGDDPSKAECQKVGKPSSYPNGITSPDGETVYVALTLTGDVDVYKRDTNTNLLDFSHSILVDSTLDNIEIDRSSNSLILGCHSYPLRFKRHAESVNHTHISPFQVFRLTPSKNDRVEEIFAYEGPELSGVSVSTVWKDKLVMGAVFDDGILVCSRNRK